jgi:hypothetical protein
MAGTGGQLARNGGDPPLQLLGDAQVLCSVVADRAHVDLGRHDAGSGGRHDRRGARLPVVRRHCCILVRDQQWLPTRTKVREKR